MKASPDQLSVSDVLALRKEQMLVVNSEYQRGAVWTTLQKQKLVDSVLRGYPIPLIYFHHIVQIAGGLRSERFEIIDGQQRINALSDFFDGAFKLLHPIKDEEKARFPDFIKAQPCPWASLSFEQLDETLKQQLMNTLLRVVKIETHNADEAVISLFGWKLACRSMRRKSVTLGQGNLPILFFVLAENQASQNIADMTSLMT